MNLLASYDVCAWYTYLIDIQNTTILRHPYPTGVELVTSSLLICKWFEKNIIKECDTNPPSVETQDYLYCYCVVHALFKILPSAMHMHN